MEKNKNDAKARLVTERNIYAVILLAFLCMSLIIAFMPKTNTTKKTEAPKVEKRVSVNGDVEKTEYFLEGALQEIGIAVHVKGGGADVFGYYVTNPERLGVMAVDENGKLPSSRRNPRSPSPIMQHRPFGCAAAWPQFRTAGYWDNDFFF